MTNVDTLAVKDFLLKLQESIVDRLAEIDPDAEIVTDQWDRDSGGSGVSRVMSGGKVIEKGGVNFSHVFGKAMPASATAERPELAGTFGSSPGLRRAVQSCPEQSKFIQRQRFPKQSRTLLKWSCHGTVSRCQMPFRGRRLPRRRHLR